MFLLYKKYFKSSLIFATIFALVAIASFQSQESPDHETLIVGLQSGYPPFEFMDAQGKIVGFDVELAELIAEKLGKKVVIKDMEFEGEILLLKQGKIDLIISGMNITPSRLKEIALIPYHGEVTTSLSLIFWNEIPQGVHVIEDIAALSNPAISVQTGAISETFMNRYPNIEVKSFQGTLAPLIDVKYGKSAANLVETDVAKYLKSQHSEIQSLSVPLPEEEIVLGFGIGIKKENHELIEKVQQFIHELKALGKLQELEEKWFKGVVQ